LALPSAALAQGSSPFSPGVPVTPETTTAPPVIQTTTTSGGSSFSSFDAILIAAGALVVLGGICYFIWRDARRRAPIHHRAPTSAGERPEHQPRPKTRKLSPAERRRRKRGRAR
jgi:hypothetical protein